MGALAAPGICRVAAAEAPACRGLDIGKWASEVLEKRMVLNCWFENLREVDEFKLSLDDSSWCRPCRMQLS